MITWPWENHAWERGFVRSAREFGVRTIGYLHTPHGRHHWGISPASNRDGLDSTPDKIVCTGAIPAKRLESLGYPSDYISVGGSLRHVVFGSLPHDPDGPVLMALPNNRDIAQQMEKIAGGWAKKNKLVLIKPHPMSPAKIRTLPDTMYTEDPLARLPPLAAVVSAKCARTAATREANTNARIMVTSMLLPTGELGLPTGEKGRVAVQMSGE